MRSLLTLLSLLTLSLSHPLTLQAQSGGGPWNADPKERAAQQTADMTQKLALSEAQAAKVGDINLKYAQQMKDARDKADGDREAMRAALRPIREAQDTELQTVLTEEQWQQWVKYREEQRANRGGFGRPSKGEEPKPEKPGGGGGR